MKLSVTGLRGVSGRGGRGRDRGWGFTIIEVIVIITILGIIAAVVAPRLIGQIGSAKQSRAKTDAASLATAMRNFMVDCGKPEPGATIDVLWERPSNVPEDRWKGPYIENREALTDPWGRRFELVIPGRKNVDFDIISYGADGQPGGTDENADVVVP
ncbi:MAG: type II secretion system major pseudopilin GspG [Phycisphaeraceae bacterium]|nr:MAG: type II secretion system major pseudopilin GspG [Phycisphaeraceae bacterium]